MCTDILGPLNKTLSTMGKSCVINPAPFLVSSPPLGLRRVYQRFLTRGIFLVLPYLEKLLSHEKASWKIGLLLSVVSISEEYRSLTVPDHSWGSVGVVFINTKYIRPLSVLQLQKRTQDDGKWLDRSGRADDVTPPSPSPSWGLLVCRVSTPEGPSHLGAMACADRSFDLGGAHE